MDLTEPILDVVSGPRGKVLATIVRHVGGASGREIAQRAGVSHATASRVLAELSTTGLVDRQVHGTAHSYRFNHQHVLAPALRQLIRPTEALARIVEDTSCRWPDPPVGAWVLAVGAARRPGAEDVLQVVLVQPEGADLDTWAERCDALAERLRRATGNDVELLEKTVATLHDQSPAAPAWRATCAPRPSRPAVAPACSCRPRTGRSRRPTGRRRRGPARRCGRR